MNKTRVLKKMNDIIHLKKRKKKRKERKRKKERLVVNILKVECSSLIGVGRIEALDSGFSWSYGTNWAIAGELSPRSLCSGAGEGDDGDSASAVCASRSRPSKHIRHHLFTPSPSHRHAEAFLPRIYGLWVGEDALRMQSMGFLPGHPLFSPLSPWQICFILIC